MKKTLNYLAITSCFVLGTTLAHANPNSPHVQMKSSQGNMDSSKENRHGKMFEYMDANSDGMVTKDEFNAFGEKKFKKMDANGDGKVSAEEMKASHKKMMGWKGNQKDGHDMNSSEKSHSQNGNSNSQHDDDDRDD